MLKQYTGVSDADNIENYILVLRGIRYVHEKNTPFTERSFHLSCSSQNGRFNSNVMDIKVCMICQTEQGRFKKFNHGS